ncbi:MAG: S-layer homology domain-containing protein, partial [Rubrobacteridae bacterium]|nr:S-layer homology domain-containing protein [Rubrobacteridae bacterium]
SPNFSSDGKVFAGTIGNGFYYSNNKGKDWSKASGISSPNIYSIAVANSSTIYVGTGDYSQTGGVYKSTNGGQSFTKVSSSNDMLYVMAVAVASNGDVYAGTNGKGIFKSTNQGQSWTAVNNNMPADSIVRSIAVSGSTIYAGVGFNASDGGVYRTTNAGQEWTKNIGNLSFVNAVAASVATVYAGTGNGIVKSVNSGQNWEDSNQEINAGSLLIAANGTVLAGTTSGVYKLSGGNWSAFNNSLTNTSVTPVAASPTYATDNIIYAGTQGSGVFTIGQDIAPSDGSGSGGSGGGSGGGGGGSGGQTPGAISAPTNLAATRTSGSINLTWNSVPGASSYNIYKKIDSGSLQKIDTASSASYSDSAISTGTNLTYYVTAVNSIGTESSASNSVTVNMSATLQAPTNLKASSTSTSIALSWDRVTEASGYNVYRRTGSVPPAKLGTTTANSFTDSSAQSGVTYTYYVTAVNSNQQESVVSNQVTASLSTVQGTVAFSDVPSNAWYKDNVSRLVSLKITSGYPNGTFGPSKTITRAEFAKMICLAMGWKVSGPSKASFGDVSKKHWAYGYVETAKARGAISGYAGALFMPEKNITRAEIAKIIAATLKLSGGSSQFKDTNGHWARASIDACVAANIIGGYPTKEFRPANSASRAEAAKMIVGVLDHK